MKQIKTLLSNPVARSSAVVFIGTMIANFGAYLYQVIVIRSMGPERYSEFAALISLLFLLSVPANVLQIVLTKYFSIFKARNELGSARALLSKVLKVILVSGGLGFPIFILVVPFLQNLLHTYSWDSFIYLYLIIISTFVVTAAAGVLNGYQKFFASSAILSILTFVRLFTGLIFAHISVALTVLGNALANIVSFVFYERSLRFIYKQPPQKISVTKKELVSFTIPTFLSTLGMTAFFNMDVVLVKHFFDSTQAGTYASLTIFGKIIYFAAVPVMTVIFPMIIERKEQNKNYQQLFLLGSIVVFILSFSIVLLYYLSSSSITELLFGEKFLVAAPYLSSYGIFMAFVTLINYFMTVCLAVNKTKAGHIVFIGAIIQTVSIIFFHASLSQVISSMSLVCGLLTCILLLYYRYDRSYIKVK